MAPLTLQLFGGFEARDASGEALSFTVKKAAALVAYLALAPDRPHSRDTLAALLWEGSGQTQGRTNLRQVLSQLRKSLAAAADPVIRADTDSVTLVAQSVRVDVHEFQRLVGRATPQALTEAMTLYRGDFLAGFDARAPGFEDWLLNERQRLRESALQAIEHRLQHHLMIDEPSVGLTLVLRQLELDPLRESAHRAAMMLYARQGQWAAALRQYRSCRTLLQRELGVAPDAETERLYWTLRHRRDGKAPRTPMGALLSESAATPIETSTDSGELRQVALVIVRLDLGSDAASEAFTRRLHRYYELARQGIDRFGGTSLNRMGGTLMGAFGIDRAHVDDPDRAARAMLWLQEQTGASADGLVVRAGIACGRVLTDGRRGASGPVIDLAATLADRAQPGQILIGEEVHRRLLGRARCGSRAEDPPGYRLDGMQPPGAEPRRLRFVGREAELGQLQQALHACKAGRGQTLVVRGAAGIGKSRLVEEAMAEAARLGLRSHRILVLDSRAENGWEEVVRGLVFRVLGLSRSPNRSECLTVVERLLAEQRLQPEEAVFLHDLLGLPPPAELAAEAEAMDRRTRYRGVRRALRDLLAAQARDAPMLLVVEDAHWAAPETLPWLATIAATTNVRIVLVLSTRTEGDPFDAGWRSGLGDAPLVTVDLGRLSDADMQALGAEMGCAEDRTKRAIARAEGNPWFLQQLLDAPESDDLPGSIQSLALARTDALPPRDRQALQAASVLGLHLTVPALRATLSWPDFDLHTLVARGLLCRDDDDGLSFSHALLRDGIYASLPTSRRVALHTSAARWFRASNHLAHAEHLDRAGHADAPAAYLAAATARAEGFQATGALQLADRGLQLAAEPGLRLALLRLQAQLLREQGQVERSIDVSRQTLELAKEGSDRAEAWLAIAAGLHVMDRYVEALDALQRAQDAAGEAGTPDLSARIEALRGNVHFPIGDIGQCRQAHARARALAASAGLSEAEARALGGLGDADYQQGLMLSAYRSFDRCIELAERHGKIAVLTANLPMRGLALLYQGRLSEGWHDCSRAAKLARRIGNTRSEMLACNAATILIEQGELAQARQRFARALELANQLRARRFQAVCLAHLGSIAVRTGDARLGVRQLREALELSHSSDEAFCAPWLYGLLAVHVEHPERQRALEEGERILEARACVGHNHLWFHRHAIDAAWTSEDPDAMRHHASALEAFTSPEPLPWADFYVRRGRLLADGLEGPLSAEQEALRAELQAEARRHGLHIALSALE